MAALTVPTIDACWKSIGVQGDQSCGELAQHSHCRNCPTFSRQAALLLDRDRPQGDLPAPAAAPLLAEPAERGTSVTIFRLGAEWFALPTLALDGIVPPRPVHSLPHRRDPGLLGLVNVRGELVICVSIARAVLGDGAGTPQGSLIVARHDGGRFAFPVDEVAQTLHHAPGAVLPLPPTLLHASSGLSRGRLLWRERHVGLLDAQALFATFNRCLM